MHLSPTSKLGYLSFNFVQNQERGNQLRFIKRCQTSKEGDARFGCLGHAIKVTLLYVYYYSNSFVYKIGFYMVLCL